MNRLQIHLEGEQTVYFDPSNKDQSVERIEKIQHTKLIAFLHPTQIELYSLRLLLNNVRGPCSYENLKAANDVPYLSFQDAAIARKLVKDDMTWIECMKEATDSYTSIQLLRKLFVSILLKCEVLSVWGQLIFFSLFIFHAWFGMLSKSVGESFILSKDEPLTPNIYGLMAL